MEKLKKQLEQFGLSFLLEKKKIKNHNPNDKKSSKVPPKKSKNGTKYIVFRLLPKDQKDAWSKQNSRYSCCQFEEEKRNEYCPYYHDYEKFYDNWIEGFEALHLD